MFPAKGIISGLESVVKLMERSIDLKLTGCAKKFETTGLYQSKVSRIKLHSRQFRLLKDWKIQS